MTDLTEQLRIAEHRIADQDRLIAHLRIVKGELELEAIRLKANAVAQAERIRELEGHTTACRRCSAELRMNELSCDKKSSFW